VWALLWGARARQAKRLLGWQFVTLIAASPLVTLAVAQSRSSYLEANLLETLGHYAGLGFLFGPGESTFAVSWWLPILATGLGVLLLGVSLLRSGNSAPLQDIGAPGPTMRLFWATASGAVVMSTAASLAFSAADMAPRSQLLMTVPVPVLVMAAARGCL